MVLLLLATLLPIAVMGSGHIALRLNEYHNIARGKLLSGSCCDGILGSDCTSVTCDPYFIIRITEQNQQTQYVDLTFQTDSLKDVDNAIFTDHIGSSPSAVNGSISLWPGAVEIYVDIMDNNSDIGIPDDLISQLSVTYTTGQPLFNRDVFFPITFQPDNSILKAEVNIRCDTDYTYDIYCQTFCHVMDNATGHVGCDSKGKQICLPGWVGNPRTGCLQARCDASTCQNGGTCRELRGSDGYLSVTCSCARPFSGRYCENSPTTTPVSTAGSNGVNTTVGTANGGIRITRPVGGASHSGGTASTSNGGNGNGSGGNVSGNSSMSSGNGSTGSGSGGNGNGGNGSNGGGSTNGNGGNGSNGSGTTNGNGGNGSNGSGTTNGNGGNGSNGSGTTNGNAGNGGNGGGTTGSGGNGNGGSGTSGSGTGSGGNGNGGSGTSGSGTGSGGNGSGGSGTSGSGTSGSGTGSGGNGSGGNGTSGSGTGSGSNGSGGSGSSGIGTGSGGNANVNGNGVGGAGGQTGNGQSNNTGGNGEGNPGTHGDDSGGSNGGAIAGGVVGGLAALSLLSLLIFLLIRRKKRAQQVDAEEDGAEGKTGDTDGETKPEKAQETEEVGLKNKESSSLGLTESHNMPEIV